MSSASEDCHVCSLDTPVTPGDKLLIRVRLSPPQMYVGQVIDVIEQSQVRLRPLTEPREYDARLEQRHSAAGMSVRVQTGGMSLRGSIHNFSKLGASIELSQKLPQGTEVELLLEDIDMTINAVARHARPTQSATFCIGFRFEVSEVTSSQLLMRMLQLSAATSDSAA
jgi:hypothetical protein